MTRKSTNLIYAGTIETPHYVHLLGAASGIPAGLLAVLAISARWFP